MCLQEVYNYYSSEFSQAAFVKLMEQQRMKVSKHIVQRILATSFWKSICIRILPINLPIHQKNRKKFCSTNLHHRFDGENFDLLWIDVDEKHFYAFNPFQVMYFPRELIGIVNMFKATSKTKTGLVMFF
jgi:hypothetical protein